jgi:hypothetical protein
MVEDEEMNRNVNSEYLTLLKDRVNLRQIPFSERGSRLLIFQSNGHLTFRLAERWFKREGQLAAYRNRPPLIEQWVFTDKEGNRWMLQDCRDRKHNILFNRSRIAPNSSLCLENLLFTLIIFELLAHM